MMIRDITPVLPSESTQHVWNLNTLMNTLVKPALKIPAHVVWGSQSGPVFDYLWTDFMKPVTDGS